MKCSGGVREVFGRYSGGVREVFGRCSGEVREVFRRCSGSIWDRFGIDLGSIWGRFGIDLASIWYRFVLRSRVIFLQIPLRYIYSASHTYIRTYIVSHLFGLHIRGFRRSEVCRFWWSTCLREVNRRRMFSARGSRRDISCSHQASCSMPRVLGWNTDC